MGYHLLGNMEADWGFAEVALAEEITPFMSDELPGKISFDSVSPIPLDNITWTYGQLIEPVNFTLKPAIKTTKHTIQEVRRRKIERSIIQIEGLETIDVDRLNTDEAKNKFSKQIHEEFGDLPK